MKLRRSWFYTPGTVFHVFQDLIPGTERKKIEKALTIAPDVVCFDIEDGVAFSAKEQARENIADTLSVLQVHFQHQQQPIPSRANSLPKRSKLM